MFPSLPHLRETWLTSFPKPKARPSVYFLTQVNRHRESTTLPPSDINSFENNQTSFPHPHRTTRLVNPSAGRGRRLSLVQELNQTIDLESSFNGDINMNIPVNDEPSVHARTWRRPERISATVINEEEEEEVSREEELPLDPGTEEANIGFYQNQIHPNQQSTEVAELRNQLNEDISELHSKLTHVENQLAILIRLMKNEKNKPQLQAKHSHSFPTPTTSSSSPHDSGKDHNGSAVNSVASRESENDGSPSWLSPTPIRSSRSYSDPNAQKPSSKRDRNNENVSPVVNLARHGRRKVSDAWKLSSREYMVRVMVLYQAWMVPREMVLVQGCQSNEWCTDQSENASAVELFQYSCIPTVVVKYGIPRKLC